MIFFANGVAMKNPNKLNAKQRELQVSRNNIVDRWASVPVLVITSAQRTPLERPTKDTNESNSSVRYYLPLVVTEGSTTHKPNLVTVLNGDDVVEAARRCG
jgi:hypothetical protein